MSTKTAQKQSVTDKMYAFIDALYQELGESRSCSDPHGLVFGVSPLDVCGPMVPADFARKWLAHNLMRKYPGFDLGIDRANIARETYFRNNDACRTAKYIRHDRYRSSFVYDAGLLIKRILGNITPERFLKELRREATFTSGASYLLGRSYSTKENKVRTVAVTEDALPILEAIIGDSLWRDRMLHCVDFNLHIVPGNTFGVVPKDAKTDRGICLEPEGNMFVQKGLGNIIRKRMLAYGVCLSSMDSTNAALALWGSETGEFATVDETSASDLLSIDVVQELFWACPEWFMLLKRARSPLTSFATGGENGGVVWKRNDLFSSMGNGFTWELESLIFYVTAVIATRKTRTVTSLFTPPFGCNQKHSEKRLASLLARFRHNQVGIFGDDLVVPSECFDEVKRCLGYIGAVVNENKSYGGDSPFRESCGLDAYNGVEVTPFYIRSDFSKAKSDSDVAPIVHKVLNDLYTWCLSCHAPHTLYLNMLAKAFEIFGDPRLTRKSALCIGPMNFGEEACIWMQPSEAWLTISRKSRTRQKQGVHRYCHLYEARIYVTQREQYEQQLGKRKHLKDSKAYKTQRVEISDDAGYIWFFIDPRKKENVWRKELTDGKLVSRRMLVSFEAYQAPNVDWTSLS